MPIIEDKLRQLGESAQWTLRDEVFQNTRDRILHLTPVKEAAGNGLLNTVVRLPYTLTDLVARPMAISALLVVMVLGGWITSVNASLSTVPGDAFYPVKLASERAQLTLSSGYARNRLRVEFANRRLGEVAVLAASDDHKKAEHLQAALNGYSQQITAVKDTIKTSNNAEEIVRLSRVIEESQESLEAILLAPTTVGNEQSVEAIVATQERTETAKKEVVTALAQSATGSTVPAEELARQFTRELRGIHAETSVLLQRLTLVEGAIAAYDRHDVIIPAAAWRFDLETVDLAGAENFAAHGGYHRAFELTASVRRSLREIELGMARAEIALTGPAPEALVPVTERVRGSVDIIDVLPEGQAADASTSADETDADDQQGPVE